MKKVIFPLTLLLVIGGLVGVFALGNKGKSPEPADPNVVSRIGVHWHPEIRVFVKGAELRIPPNIAISGQQMGEIHTHADLPKIHYELAGPVTKDETTVGAFFRAWVQTFEGQLKMTVNGQPNDENLNYQVKDGDKIELRYE